MQRIVFARSVAKAKNYRIVVEFAGANGDVSGSPFCCYLCHEESVIAFMGEEKVLRGGDNVLAATTEASLSEIKHDATEGWIEDRRGGVEVPPSRSLDFPLQRFLPHITSD